MNGTEKKEFYLEYIYSLRMDVYRIIKSVIGDANVTEELAFYRIGSRQIKSKGMAESDHEKCFA